MERQSLKALTVTFILLITTTGLFAQHAAESMDSRPLNSICLNLLGDGSLISGNYERQFFVKSIFFVSGKLGLGYNKKFQLCIFGPCSSPPDKYLTVPHHITGNIGKGRHFFEFGFGGTIFMGKTTQPYLFYPIVGYKILPLRSNKLNFRIFGYIPFSKTQTGDILIIPFGLSLGLSF
jgi:hypothetical protein